MKSHDLKWFLSFCSAGFSGVWYRSVMVFLILNFVWNHLCSFCLGSYTWLFSHYFSSGFGSEIKSICRGEERPWATNLNRISFTGSVMMEKNKDAALFFDRILLFGFLCHDVVVKVLLRNMFFLKRLILVGAYLVLALFFLPIFTLLRRDFGEIAGNLLIVILFLSPLSTLLRIRLLSVLMGFRRELGILMGCLALVHGLGYFLSPGFLWEKGVVTGWMGLLLIFPLLLTSNNFALRFLGGKLWKRLHRLVYPAFFFIVWHQFFMGLPHRSWTPLFEVILLLGAYSLAKFLVWRPETWPWLQKAVKAIGIRYQRYQNT